MNTDVQKGNPWNRFHDFFTETGNAKIEDTLDEVLEDLVTSTQKERLDYGNGR